MSRAGWAYIAVVVGFFSFAVGVVVAAAARQWNGWDDES